MSGLILSRRRILLGGAATIGGLTLGGCDPLSRSPSFRDFLGGAETLTLNTQRALMIGQPLAREFSERDMSPVFRANGTRDPMSADYKAMTAAGFSNWRLVVDGLVNSPQTYSIADLKALPQRTQITRHDCVEGWSAIGKWMGPQLGTLLMAASLKPNARFAVFHCADNYGGGADMYYESVDLVDAFHPQTILAHTMNDKPLEVAHGAPIRLRVERQLGYKQAKYVMRVEIVESLAGIGRGKGGFWEDLGYQWYAGI